MTNTQEPSSQPKYNLMVDLETLSLSNDACIVSAGLVVFSSTKILETYSAGIKDLEDQVRKGSHISPDTVIWWLKQSDAARHSLIRSIEGPSMVAPIKTIELLNNISVLFVNCKAIWSKDSCFDINILERAYQRYELPIPWKYHQRRCVRTLFEEWPQVPKVMPTVKHDPLDDAKAQTTTILNIWKHKALLESPLD